jgi:diguanylate cyclase (GGDEF)-like protein
MVSSFVDAEARRSVLAERAVACADSVELEHFAAMAAEVFQVSRAAISVSDGGRQRIIAGFGLEHGLIGELEPVLNEAAAGGGRAPAGSAGPDTRTARLGFVHCTPLSCGGPVLGCLLIADEAPRRFSARGTALMEALAIVALEQLYLVCVARKLGELAQQRLEEGHALSVQTRELRRRLGQIARLGGIGGWMFDIESDQMLWTDDLPGGLAEETPALASGDLLSLAERSGGEAIRRALRRTIENGVPLELELPVRLADGASCWLRMVGEREAEEGATDRVVGIMQDVSERYRADEKISYLSQCDPLTGLPNRTVFQDRLQATVRWAVRSRNRGAVLVLDIDGFSEINDRIGCEGGDAALARLAERLSAVVRASDSVARLGGDRFGVIMSGMEAAGDVMKLAERLLQAAAQALDDSAAGGGLSASVGIALFPMDGPAATQLLRSAEIALARAKSGGGGGYAFYTADMAALAERRRHLMAEVRAGLEADQFVVAYQPKIDLRTNRLAGFEALIRWEHPERGLLTPGAFWDALTDPALGKQLSDAVLAKVTRQLALWRQAGVEAGPVAVNIAAGQLRDPGFTDQIRALLRQSGLPPQALRLEITEGVLLGRRSDRAVRALHGIHEIGIDTELDDFGTGYASLTHLRQYPVNRLKIDKSFVTDLEDPHNETIVGAVIEMAHGLKMEVIAEGVETTDTDRRLRQLGCDYGQGFYYSRPVPAEGVAAFVQEWQQALNQAAPLRVIK